MCIKVSKAKDKLCDKSLKGIDYLKDPYYKQ